MILFETSRLLVRTQDIADADLYFRLYGDPEVVKYIRAPKTRGECLDFLQEHLELNKQLFPLGRFLVDNKITGEFIGSFVLIPIGNSSDIQIGYALLKEQWGKGFATELVKAGINYFFSNSSLKNLYAITESANQPSIQVLLKCGFVFENSTSDTSTVLNRYVLGKNV